MQQTAKIVVLVVIILLAFYALAYASDVKIFDSRGIYQGQVAWTGNSGVVISPHGTILGSISKSADAYKFYDSRGILQLTAWGDKAVPYIINAATTK